jgi:hypothetical protein
MNITKKRELLKEVVISQLEQAKLEPFKTIKLVEFIDKMTDKKVEKIIKISIQNQDE